jgi:hypothetical protein
MAGGLIYLGVALAGVLTLGVDWYWFLCGCIDTQQTYCYPVVCI